MDNLSEHNNEVSTLAVRQLQGTRPWVKFISILLFISAGLMLLIAVFIVIGGLFGSLAGGMDSGAAPAGLMMIGMGVVYAISSLIYIYPALKLWKYAAAIGRLIASENEQDLVEALDQQRGFWKFVGIVMLVILGIYALVIVIVLIALACGAAMLS